MTMSRSNSRWYSISLLLALCLCTSAIRAEVPLRAFTASYELRLGSMSLGTAELSLEPLRDEWRWRLQTRARGIYAMFIHKKPYSETTFSQSHDALRLRKILIADANDEDQTESARFNWERGRLQVSRKGRQSELALNSDVHDYQSIHLLAADMQLRQQQVRDLTFYRKGKLIDSRLAYLGEANLEIDSKEISARLYRQTFDGSATEIDYYYDARAPLLPLLIERRESNEEPSVLRLRKVEWRS